MERCQKKTGGVMLGLRLQSWDTGGIGYVSVLFEMDPKTVRRGLTELELPEEPEPGRVRKKGAGRKASTGHKPLLEENFLKLLAEFTAGDPMRDGVSWANLSRCGISRRLAEMGTSASRHTVRKPLKKQGLGQRKTLREVAITKIPIIMIIYCKN